MHVTTTAGTVAGRRQATRFGEVETFSGVPYADGGSARRFRPAGAPSTWEGVRDATSPAPAAPQNPDPTFAMRGLEQEPWSEEGCLVANVWTPGVDESSRPVMVWVHGGAYVSGSPNAGTTDGAALAASGDVVVVALGYRLGAFGFLFLGDALGDEFADSGNVGVLDIVAGLEWVRTNAAAFGGDPARVTLFGESAGAAAVGTILGMPAAEGLFARAIMQSGTAERVRSRADAASATERFLRIAGLSATSAAELLAWAPERILEAQERFAAEVAQETIGVPLPFVPVVDGRSLDRVPLEAVRGGASRNVALLAGTNLNESSFATAMMPQEARTEPALDQMLETVLDGAGISAETYREALGRDLGRPATTLEGAEAALTDGQYRQPTRRLLDARAEQQGSSFAYLFTWPSPAFGGALGSCHALDQPFVFRSLEAPDSAFLVGDDPPVGLSRAMSTAWTRFAHTGTPEASDLPAWPAYEAGSRSTMQLDADPEVVHDPRGALRRLWEQSARG